MTCVRRIELTSLVFAVLRRFSTDGFRYKAFFPELDIACFAFGIVSCPVFDAMRMLSVLSRLGCGLPERSAIARLLSWAC